MCHTHSSDLPNYRRKRTVARSSNDRARAAARILLSIEVGNNAACTKFPQDCEVVLSLGSLSSTILWKVGAEAQVGAFCESTL
jgi:hypothetical protein